MQVGTFVHTCECLRKHPVQWLERERDEERKRTKKKKKETERARGQCVKEKERERMKEYAERTMVVLSTSSYTTAL